MPDEDEAMRAVSMTRTRGGNATNTLHMIAQLGGTTSWIGVVPAMDRDDTQCVPDVS